MARNRMIKKEFWEDDKISECSVTARLLFIALWNIADDEGYLEYRTKWIKTKCFPYDKLEIKPLIDELLGVGVLLEQGGILWVKNFLKHQQINRPTPSVLSHLFINSVSTHGGLPPNIKESKGKKKKEKSACALKESFGEDSAVFLSKEEWVKLCRRHGYYVVKRFVDQLNNYIKQVGKDKYASHYHTILNWISKARTKGEFKPSADDYRVDDFESTAEYEAVLNKFNR